MEALKMNIPDESYRSNFIGLTKELAPDGKKYQCSVLQPSIMDILILFLYKETKKHIRYDNE